MREGGKDRPMEGESCASSGESYLVSTIYVRYVYLLHTVRRLLIEALQ